MGAQVRSISVNDYPGVNSIDAALIGRRSADDESAARPTVVAAVVWLRISKPATKFRLPGMHVLGNIFHAAGMEGEGLPCCASPSSPVRSGRRCIQTGNRSSGTVGQSRYVSSGLTSGIILGPLVLPILLRQ